MRPEERAASASGASRSNAPASSAATPTGARLRRRARMRGPKSQKSRRHYCRKCVRALRRACSAAATRTALLACPRCCVARRRLRSGRQPSAAIRALRRGPCYRAGGRSRAPRSGAAGVAKAQARAASHLRGAGAVRGARVQHSGGQAASTARREPNTSHAGANNARLAPAPSAMTAARRSAKKRGGRRGCLASSASDGGNGVSSALHSAALRAGRHSNLQGAHRHCS